MRRGNFLIFRFRIFGTNLDDLEYLEYLDSFSSHCFKALHVLDLESYSRGWTTEARFKMVARQMEFLRHGFWTAAPIILARTHPVVGAVARPAGC